VVLCAASLAWNADDHEGLLEDPVRVVGERIGKEFGDELSDFLTVLRGRRRELFSDDPGSSVCPRRRRRGSSRSEFECRSSEARD
jgi:hypothetical protein